MIDFLWLWGVGGGGNSSTPWGPPRGSYLLATCGGHDLLVVTRGQEYLCVSVYRKRCLSKDWDHYADPIVMCFFSYFFFFFFHNEFIFSNSTASESDRTLLKES